MLHEWHLARLPVFVLSFLQFTSHVVRMDSCAVSLFENCYLMGIALKTQSILKLTLWLHRGKARGSDLYLFLIILEGDHTSFPLPSRQTS